MVYLLETFARAARRDTVLVLAAGPTLRRIPWRDLDAAARVGAANLRQRGIGPGHTVALLGDTSIELVTALRAILLAGASLHVVQHPPRTTTATLYHTELRRRLDALDCTTLLVASPFDQPIPSNELVSPVTSPPSRPVLRVAEVLARPARGRYVEPQLTDDDTAVVQLTSGTTGTPQVARVSHANLAANIAGIGAAAERDFGTDVLCSWLPLHHDMGLIGFLLLPMSVGCPLVLLPTGEFTRRPMCWLETVSAYRATATGAPNFAYATVARLLPRSPPLRLSQLSFALCGAEPVVPDNAEAFIRAAGRHGMRSSAFVAAYGLAEATLAVSLSPAGRGLVTDVVDADKLSAGRAVPPDPGRAVPPDPGRASRRLTVVGQPLPGLAVRVVDADGGLLPPRHVGEIQVSGPSVAKVESIRDGWLDTGDLGYLTDAGLVICGRRKDVLIVAGRNIYPEDVEQAAATVPGVRPGNVAAVPDPAPGETDRIAILAEARSPDRDESLIPAITAAVHHAIGVRPTTVRLLAPGTLPKTTSGKLRRRDAATLFLTPPRDVRS